MCLISSRDWTRRVWVSMAAACALACAPDELISSWALAV